MPGPDSLVILLMYSFTAVMTSMIQFVIYVFNKIKDFTIQNYKEKNINILVSRFFVCSICF